MKLLKLLLIAIILIGGIYGVMQLTIPENEVDTPDFTSAQANNWKQKIIDLCKDGKWTADAYASIESGIHTDRVTSKGELISMDEEISLQKYLFALACSYVKEGLDKLFQQSHYPDNKVKYYENALDLLQEKSATQGGNGNLAEASKLYAAYHKIMGLLSFGAKASYSRPLKAYNGGSASGRKSTIMSIDFYKSHFSKNDAIRSRVSRLDIDMKRAEQEYYSNLEKCVEDNYKRNGRIEELLEDQIRFDEISTNSEAKKRLNDFINNDN